MVFIREIIAVPWPGLHAMGRIALPWFSRVGPDMNRPSLARISSRGFAYGVSNHPISRCPRSPDVPIPPRLRASAVKIGFLVSAITLPLSSPCSSSSRSTPPVGSCRPGAQSVWNPSHSLTVRFTDRTALALGISPGFTINAEYYREQGLGDPKVFKRWPEISSEQLP
jgi:hypothetical protein